MWALSLLQVVLLCYYSAPTLESRKWRNRLHFLKINPSMYSYLFFQSQCAVYVKLPFHAPDSPHFGYTQHGHFYVGSTAVSVAKWDFNRQAKFKQLRNGQAIHVELSIRYWSSSGNFNIYNTIVLEAHTTYDHAWVREHCLISYWQPALNHPFILPHLKLKSEGWKFQFKSNRHTPVKLGPRLFQRLRRRLKTVGSVPRQHSHQQNAWQLLYSLSLFTRVSYETCQRIRSGEFDTLEVYALYRLAAHMEEPGRSRVRSLISKALQFRNATEELTVFSSFSGAFWF